MSLIKSLDQITPADAARVGGKAYNRARLKQAGFPVPDARKLECLGIKGSYKISGKVGRGKGR